MAQSARIVLIGGEKGGSAKTTCAINLAVMLGKEGKDVLLVDTDPQQTAMSWQAFRTEQQIEPRITCKQLAGVGLGNELDNLAGQFDEIIIDAGGRDSIELRTAMTRAHIMVSPVQLSSFDLWTLRRLEYLAEQVEPVNPHLQVYVMLSRAPINQSQAEYDDAVKVISDFSKLSLLKSVMRERVAYRRSAGMGLSVVEYTPRDEKAIEEVNSLYKEVYQL